MKRKGLMRFGCLLAACALGLLAGCKGTEQQGDSALESGAAESALESMADSAVQSEPEDGLDKNEQLNTRVEALVQGGVTLHYPVLEKMDVREKQDRLNALLLEDARACLKNAFPAGDASTGVLDVTEGYHTKQYLSFVSTGSFVQDGSTEARTVFYVTNLDLQTGERFETPVREQAASLAKRILSGEGYRVLSPSDTLRQKQQDYLLSLSEQHLTALFEGCDYTETDAAPRCFSYPLGEGNYAIYIPVPSSLTGYATIQVRLSDEQAQTDAASSAPLSEQTEQA